MAKPRSDWEMPSFTLRILGTLFFTNQIVPRKRQPGQQAQRLHIAQAISVRPNASGGSLEDSSRCLRPKITYHTILNRILRSLLCELYARDILALS